jgi:hypothetical protein
MAGAMGISEGEAWQIINKEDRYTFVNNAMNLGIQSGMINQLNMRDFRNEAGAIWDAEHGVQPAVGTPGAKTRDDLLNIYTGKGTK